MSGQAELIVALAAHDRALADRGLTVWVGAEPTFTDRFSEADEWHAAAVGADKEARARRLAACLATRLPGKVLLRTLGRRYPGEERRRFSYGLLARRDGAALWDGPPDPLCGGLSADRDAPARLAKALGAALTGAGFEGFATAAPDGSQRVVLRLDGEPPVPGPGNPLLCLPSLHDDDRELVRVAEDVPCVLIVSLVRDGDQDCVALELPPLPPDTFPALLEVAARAARDAGLGGLMLRGAPPPADPRFAFSTLTPDPGVLEVNQAPTASVVDLWAENRRLFDAAAQEGLAPLRLHYNGQVDDSGGGGQLSIGGPTPEESPFRVQPQLAPRLVRYLNHHPSLSFWFAPHYVGACSQAPRPDEGIPDLFNELALALDLLAAQPDPPPRLVWASLSPFLRDVGGNSHRSEVNIEKLWSPVPRADGIDGVVEFRAFRMARTAESLAALGALLRGLVAMLMVRPFEEPLVDWGPRLHDRFALPHFLARDLESVLADLEAWGFGLHPLLSDLLLEDSTRIIARLDCGEGVTLKVSAALEFWPQVGDSLSQPADSRLVDASTARLELLLTAAAPQRLADWSLTVGGWSVPLRTDVTPKGAVAVMGVRDRRYPPGPLGLHPGVLPVLPVRLSLYHRDGRLIEADYHEWRPQGGPYPGLPEDLDEAARRRAARLVVRRSRSGEAPPAREPCPAAVTEHCFDLRRA